MEAMRDEASGWREIPDERELARLDLVGLACEVVTLATRIAEAVDDSADPRALETGGRRNALASRALALLAADTDFAAFSDAALDQALDLLRDDQQAMLQLRDEIDRLLASWSTL